MSLIYLVFPKITLTLQSFHCHVYSVGRFSNLPASCAHNPIIIRIHATFVCRVNRKLKLLSLSAEWTRDSISMKNVPLLTVMNLRSILVPSGMSFVNRSSSLFIIQIFESKNTSKPIQIQRDKLLMYIRLPNSCILPLSLKSWFALLFVFLNTLPDLLGMNSLDTLIS